MTILHGPAFRSAAVIGKSWNGAKTSRSIDHSVAKKAVIAAWIGGSSDTEANAQ